MSTAPAAASPADGAAKPGKKKLVVILIVVLALLAIAGGGAAWWFHQKAAVEAKGDEGKATKKAEASKPPVFSTLENFTVNLAGGDHFMQLGIVLQLKDDETAEKVKTFLPQIRNRILLILSAKTADDIEAPKGKEALIGELLEATRAPLGAEGGENVQAVLLGSLLIQ